MQVRSLTRNCVSRSVYKYVPCCITEALWLYNGTHVRTASSMSSVFRTAFDRAEPSCRQAALLPRWYDISVPTTTHSQWSITAESFPLNSTTSGSASNIATSAECTNIAALLHAVKMGWRKNGAKGSAFHPRGCSIPYFSAARACSALSLFSSVVLIGDSMIRHVLQALTLLLTEDMEFGAMPLPPARPHPLLSAWTRARRAEVLKWCACDSQFSEHDLCREWYRESFNLTNAFLRERDGARARVKADAALNETYPALYTFSSRTKHSLSLPDVCKEAQRLVLVDAARIASLRVMREDEWRRLLCTNLVDERLSPAILMQTGPHHIGRNHSGQSDPDHVIHANLDPVLRTIMRVAHNCSHGARPAQLLWTGLTAQVATMDAKYDGQAKGRATALNEDVGRHVQRRWGAYVIDFYNLTDGAAASDGYHLLTEGNVAKANVLLHSLELLGSTMRR